MYNLTHRGVIGEGGGGAETDGGRPGGEGYPPRETDDFGRVRRSEGGDPPPLPRRETDACERSEGGVHALPVPAGVMSTSQTRRMYSSASWVLLPHVAGRLQTQDRPSDAVGAAIRGVNELFTPFSIGDPPPPSGPSPDARRKIWSEIEGAPLTLPNARRTSLGGARPQEAPLPLTDPLSPPGGVDGARRTTSRDGVATHRCADALVQRAVSRHAALATAKIPSQSRAPVTSKLWNFSLEAAWNARAACAWACRTLRLQARRSAAAAPALTALPTSSSAHARVVDSMGSGFFVTF